jgi:hypothetical protein
MIELAGRIGHRPASIRRAGQCVTAQALPATRTRQYDMADGNGLPAP